MTRAFSCFIRHQTDYIDIYENNIKKVGGTSASQKLCIAHFAIAKTKQKLLKLSYDPTNNTRKRGERGWGVSREWIS